MISFKSIKNFFSINSLIFGVSYIEYSLTSNDIFSNFLIFLTRNYFFIDFINSKLKDKLFIHGEKRLKPFEQFYREFDIFVISTTLLETLTTTYINQNLISSNSLNLYYFIPLSFTFEIFFDFFHYCAHRFVHENKFFYKHIHKIHHKFPYPKAITTFYQHPIDIFLANSLPTIFAFYLTDKYFFEISPLMFHVLMNYKVFIEITGHVGKETNTSSFSQFIWFPKLFGIELYIKDHDKHHSENNCNFSKRFSLFDKLFGTYKR
jgi:sterol desaturase/sphingolipid hydroxylase (fatty acid hydroxylase superfamily)